VTLTGASNAQPSATLKALHTGFDDVTFDLISVQYHSLKAGHAYGE
jgi:hypothetical protein